MYFLSLGLKGLMLEMSTVIVFSLHSITLPVYYSNYYCSWQPSVVLHMLDAVQLCGVLRTVHTYVLYWYCAFHLNRQSPKWLPSFQKEYHLLSCVNYFTITDQYCTQLFSLFSPALDLFVWLLAVFVWSSKEATWSIQCCWQSRGVNFCWWAQVAGIWCIQSWLYVLQEWLVWFGGSPLGNAVGDADSSCPLGHPHYLHDQCHCGNFHWAPKQRQ